MKTIFFTICIMLFSTITVSAQEWNGTLTPTSNINRDGNVSIGTTDASAKFVVRGSVKFSDLALSNAAPRFVMMDANGSLFYKNSSSIFTNSCTTTNFLTKRDASGNLTCSSISDDGTYIKVGTPSSDHGYHQISGIVNITDGYLKIWNGSTMSISDLGSNFKASVLLLDNNKAFDGSNVDGTMWGLVNSRENTALGLKNGFSINSNYGQEPRLFIEDITGKVGIGTTNLSCGTCDDYMLFVKKGIKTERVKVEVATVAGWADYVFEEDYKLPTLAEVETQIKEKGHLADIPSAEEVVENGVELGEMNKLLLQKIEELTLYMIEQNKINEKQAKEIEELKGLMSVKK